MVDECHALVDSFTLGREVVVQFSIYVFLNAKSLANCKEEGEGGYYGEYGLVGHCRGL